LANAAIEGRSSTLRCWKNGRLYSIRSKNSPTAPRGTAASHPRSSYRA
jgi:hypothetical protein